MSQTHVTFKWLKADFYILVTGTPHINRVDDIKGYRPFIESRTFDVWNTQNLAALEISDDINPFLSPEDSIVARQLCSTVKAG